MCLYACPHAVIRPFLMTEEEAKAAPAGIKKAQGNGPLKEYTNYNTDFYDSYRLWQLRRCLSGLSKRLLL